jgi:hypothetical protein
MLEKRQSLSKEDIDQKLQEADQRRRESLDEKIQLAKELEGHGSACAHMKQRSEGRKHIKIRKCKHKHEH